MDLVSPPPKMYSKEFKSPREKSQLCKFGLNLDEKRLYDSGSSRDGLEDMLSALKLFLHKVALNCVGCH